MIRARFAGRAANGRVWEGSRMSEADHSQHEEPEVHLESGAEPEAHLESGAEPESGEAASPEPEP